MPILNLALQQEYSHLFNTCIIKESKYPAVDACVDKILSVKSRYHTVSQKTTVPWYFIGIIHQMECSGNFRTHLHNGDPLTARTVHVPRNHPKSGKPPFTWEFSAEDALKLKSLHTWTDWSIPGMLYQLERYNGFGYRGKGINSPYLWSFSNHYKKGKYTSDGVYDPEAVSKQIGAAVLLRRISERQIAIGGESDLITHIRLIGEDVPFARRTYNAKAELLQRLLNSAGQHLRVDGYAGPLTSSAYHRVSGTYLTGDPRKGKRKTESEEIRLKK